MTRTQILALAIGHVRNATWQFLNDPGADITLGLDCLDVEALLNPDDLDPAAPPVPADPAASLAAARDLLDQVPDEVPPAGWAALLALGARVG